MPIAWPSHVSPGQLAEADHINGILDNAARIDTDNVFGAFHQDLSELSAPGAPAVGTRSLFVDQATGKLSVRSSSGTTISLEEQGAVTSVFGRTGGVLSASGDYNAAQITNAFDLTQDNTVGGHYIDVTGIAAPSNPSSGHRRIFVDTADDKLKVRTSAGISISLEEQGAVTSVFGRAGVVVSASGDYNVAQVTGAVPETRQISSGTGLSGGGTLTADLLLAVVDDTTIQRVSAYKDGALVGSRPAVNFIAGSNVSITATENVADNRVDVTIASSLNTFADGITPSGVIDGANATFTLPQSPSPAASLILVRNQLVQVQSTHYTLSGNTIVFLVNNIPESGDGLRAWYRH